MKSGNQKLMKRVLIVEDSGITVLHLQLLLEDNGIEVISNINYAEHVVETVRLESPDAIIMDVKLLGKLSGVEAALEVRKFSDLPIIFLSGTVDNHSLAQIKEISNSYFFKKPFEPEALLSHLRGMHTPNKTLY